MARKKKGVVEADERGFNYAQNRLSKKAQEALAAGRVKALEELLLEEEMANTKDPAEKNVVNGQLSWQNVHVNRRFHVVLGSVR